MALSQVWMRVRAGETLRISDGRIDHQITHSMADEIASGIFGPRNPTTLMQVPELAWSNVQDEMDAVLASVFKTMARSGEELRALLGVLVAVARKSPGSLQTSNSADMDLGDSSASCQEEPKPTGESLPPAQKSTKTTEFSCAREWLSARLCDQLEAVALGNATDGARHVPLQAASPYSVLFFLLEAIRDVGPVPGVIERLGKFSRGPVYTDDYDSDAGSYLEDGDAEEGGEFTNELTLADSPLLSLALSEVLRSMLAGSGRP